MARLALSALVLLCACSPDASQPRQQAVAVKPKRGAAIAPIAKEAPEPDIVITPRAGHFIARSTVHGYALIATDMLPRIEQVRTSVPRCDEWGEIDPKTPGGKAAKALGWRVTDEKSIGRLTAVTILRRYESWPGLYCMPVTSNIVFFEAGTVVAILHPAPGPYFIPAALESMRGGALRVWTTMPAPPVGDLTLIGKTLRLSTTASVDTLCDGQVKIPNLFRKPITEARAILLRHGWKPSRLGPIDRDTDEYYRFYRKGITEIDSCAVDSVGQCLFDYKSRHGLLEVETGQLDDGDKEGVISYGIDCAKRPTR